MTSTFDILLVLLRGAGVTVQVTVLAAGVGCLLSLAAAFGTRSAILAVPKGQREAVVALNLSPLQSMRRVVLPQALPMMLPPFGNLLIELLKGTALVSLITLSDATLQAMQLRTSMPSREPEIFALLLVICFVLACPLMIGVRWLERRDAVGRR